MTLRELHLFAGIGGGILGGMLLGHRCVGAVEIDPYCRRVLEARQRDGILEPFPIHDDIRTFDGTAWRGRVDIVCGGFPCQPWSSAGKRLGTADQRHLWPEMARVVSEVRPPYVFAENVSLEAFREPLSDLQRMGYRVPPAIRLGSGDLGSLDRRRRWWVIAADADLFRCEGGPLSTEAQEKESAMAVAHRMGTSERRRQWRFVERRLRRIVPWSRTGVDRLRALGNAQVPAVVATAFRELMARMGR